MENVENYLNGKLQATPVVEVESYEAVKSYLNGKLQATPVTIVGGKVSTTPADELFATNAEMQAFATPVENMTCIVFSDETLEGATALYKFLGGSWVLQSSKSNPYTKTEIDILLDSKVDKTIYDTYTSQNDVNITNLQNDVGLKVNVNDVYTKVEVDSSQLAQDNRMTAIENVNTTQTNNINLKANAIDVYTKTEVDASQNAQNTIISNKLDVTTYNNEKVKTLLNNSKTPTTAITILPGATYNFLQQFVTSDLIVLGKQGFSITGTGANALLKFPSNENFVNYSIQITINGSITGAAGTTREFKVQLARTTPTVLVRSLGIVKVDNNTLTDRSNPPILTFTNGVNDPFTTNGIRLELNNTTTQTITINSFQIMIHGN